MNNIVIGFEYSVILVLLVSLFVGYIIGMCELTHWLFGEECELLCFVVTFTPIFIGAGMFLAFTNPV